MRRSRISHPSHKDPHVIDKCNLTRKFFFGHELQGVVLLSRGIHIIIIYQLCVLRLVSGYFIGYVEGELFSTAGVKLAKFLIIDSPRRHRQLGLDEPYLLPCLFRLFQSAD